MQQADAMAESLDEYHRKRDFRRTAEPRGTPGRKRARRSETRTLEFVVQKHAASHLHFDFRLELDGAMKSWAVPKGPSLDPAVRRLAMETEDHPMAYNEFEGIIPAGEYGGGTVMIWDRGHYRADDVPRGGADEDELRKGYASGKLSFTLHGERLRGSWALVRTRSRDGDGRSWLLLKHRDEFAAADRDVVAEFATSVVSGRTLEEIAAEAPRVWRSNRGRPDAAAAADADAPGAAIKPMQPTAARTLPTDDGWSFTPDSGGTRVLAWVTPARVQLLTARGADRTGDVPDIVRELARLAGRGDRSLVLDATLHDDGPAPRLVVLDLLLDNGAPLLDVPWSERRTRLERLYRRRVQRHVRLAPAFDDAADAEAAARDGGHAALLARRLVSAYRPGARSRDWRRVPIP